MQLQPKPVKAWPDRDGTLHATIEEWQAHEMRTQIKLSNGASLMNDEQIARLAADLIDGRDAVIAILTTGPKSRPGARKKAGTTQPKRAVKGQPKAASQGIVDAISNALSKPATPQEAQAGFKAMREAITAEEKAHVEDVTGMPFQPA